MQVHYQMQGESLASESKLLHSKKFFIKRIGNSYCATNNSWMNTHLACTTQIHIEMKRQAHSTHRSSQAQEREFSSPKVLQMKSELFYKEEIHHREDQILEIMGMELPNISSILLTPPGNQHGQQIQASQLFPMLMVIFHQFQQHLRVSKARRRERVRSSNPVQRLSMLRRAAEAIMLDLIKVLLGLGMFRCSRNGSVESNSYKHTKNIRIRKRQTRKRR